MFSGVIKREHWEQKNYNITKEDVSIHLRKMSNWKVPGSDGLHGLWLKKFTSLYQAMLKHLDDCTHTGDVPNWMVESCTERCEKEECCWQLQTNSLLESSLEITDWYY